MAAMRMTAPLMANTMNSVSPMSLRLWSSMHQEEHAEHRPNDLALAAEQAGAADDRRSDDVEQDVGPDDWLPVSSRPV